jgi:hypothetical protein
MPPLTRARADAAQAPPTLLDALARAPAAAALAVAALDEGERKALRLVHSQLRDAVSEATTKLATDFEVSPDVRPPTARRWPRLEELTMRRPDLAALEALGAETWALLRALIFYPGLDATSDAPSDARALATALRRMPALRVLELWAVQLPDEVARELFSASSAGAAPQLRALDIWNAGFAPVAARSLAAPTFALRRLGLSGCGLGAAAVGVLAAASWPLEKLDLSFNDFSAAAAGPALAALSRHTRLRELASPTAI